MKLWDAARNFSELIALNRKFLSGQISEAPYHGGPIDEETIPLRPSLLKLHNFGLITISSQPYYYWVDQSDNGWAEIQQNPYLSFFMSGRDVPYLEFFEKLKERVDIVVYAQELPLFRVLPGSHGAHVVIRDRTANAEEDLEAAEWELGESICVNEDVSEQFDWLCRKVEKPVYFDVAAREFGPPIDLQRVIEEVAIASGLPQMY